MQHLIILIYEVEQAIEQSQIKMRAISATQLLEGRINKELMDKVSNILIKYKQYILNNN